MGRALGLGPPATWPAASTRPMHEIRPRQVESHFEKKRQSGIASLPRAAAGRNVLAVAHDARSIPNSPGAWAAELYFFFGRRRARERAKKPRTEQGMRHASFGPRSSAPPSCVLGWSNVNARPRRGTRQTKPPKSSRRPKAEGESGLRGYGQPRKSNQPPQSLSERIRPHTVWDDRPRAFLCFVVLSV